MCWSASAAMACQASNRKHYPIDLIKHYPIDLTHLLSPFCPFPRSKPSDQNTGGTKARAPAPALPSPPPPRLGIAGAMALTTAAREGIVGSASFPALSTHIHLSPASFKGVDPMPVVACVCMIELRSRQPVGGCHWVIFRVLLW